MKRLLITALLSILMTSPAYGMTCHDLAMSYVIHDQDLPQKPGEKLYTDEINENPVLLETTGYCQGTHGSHGDRMQKGYVAYTPESYGWDVELYQAVETDEGYELGDYIGRFAVKDTGYGRETGTGKSKVRKDKPSAGTIETGQSLDVYHPTLSECKDWMRETNGRVFAVIIENPKG